MLTLPARRPDAVVVALRARAAADAADDDGTRLVAEEVDDEKLSIALRLMKDETAEELKRSDQHFRFVAQAVEDGHTNGEILALVRGYDPSTAKYGHGALLERETRRVIRKFRAKGVDDEKLIVSSPSEPLPNAHKFVADNYSHPERELLMHHGGSFEAYSGTCWPEIEVDGLRAQVWNYFGGAIVLDAKGKAHPFKPNRDRVGNIVDALKAATHQPKDVTAPAWLRAHDVAADEIVALGNGLLHVPTRTLLPHTSTFYTNWALPFAYDCFALAPKKWLAFLNDLFDDDDELKRTLQELFGYLISNDTRQQKIFNLIGPKRAGKGVIARVVTGLLGPHNVAAPTLSSLSTEFGLQPLIGKPLALIADARLRAQDERIVERMLTISGEDSITIPRKHIDSYTGRLPTRFVLISNEIPQLRDASGALAARVILIPFTRSFYGKEDPDLTDNLLAELPGILNWSLDGLERLRKRGRFVQPKAAAEIVREMEDLGSPISAFVRDCCVLGAEHRVVVEVLYLQWRTWCNAQGIDRPGDVQAFGRDLRATLPGVGVVRPASTVAARSAVTRASGSVETR